MSYVRHVPIPGNNGGVGRGTTHEIETTATAVLIRIAGEIDLSASEDVAKWIMEAIPEDPPMALEVDLSGVTFLDSTGIRALVLGQQAAGRNGVTMRVTGPQGRVEAVLKITGVYEMLTQPPPVSR
jgi:anti-sigma B factor antagonist